MKKREDFFKGLDFDKQNYFLTFKKKFRKQNANVFFL